MDDETQRLKTVIRAFEILDVLESERGAGPAAVADRLGISRSTAHDYLVSLRSVGYVTREDGSYRVGYRFLQRGSRLKYRNQFFNAAKLPMENLSAETGNLSQIGIEEAGEWVLLHGINSTTSVRMGTYPGLRTPIHTHAAGKVLLAELPDARVKQILDTHGLTEVTDETITDEAELQAECDRIAEDGYAVDWNEQVIGIGFIAAPVVVDGKLLGSVSIASPAGRLQREEYREERIQDVIATAEEISINYQYNR